MKVKNPQVGGIAKSTQGRDKNCHYIIVAIQQNGYVLVSDGKYKTVSSPKKKSVKHLCLTPFIQEEIAQRLASGKNVYDYEIKTVLKNYIKTENSAK